METKAQKTEEAVEDITIDPVSIVIPVWNNMEYLPKLFESLIAKTKVRHEIIIVDQGSTDGSIEFCKKEPHDLIIENKFNTGSTGAWNQGIHQASNDFIMLLNSDIEILKEGWLEIMQRQFENERVGIIECLELIHNGETRWSGAASPMLRREMIEDIGMFDDKNLWGFCGDTDYWIRAMWHKWEMGWCKELLLYHDCGGTHRRGQLKDSANKDHEEGNRILREKWTPLMIMNGWNKPRIEAEKWLQEERKAGRLK